MQNDYSNTLSELLKQNNKLLSFQIDLRGVVRESNKGWTGAISNFIDEESSLGILTNIPRQDLSITLKKELGDQTFYGHAINDNQFITFLGNNPNDQQKFTVNISKEGIVLDSNSPDFHAEESFIKEFSTTRTKLKLKNSLAYCLKHNSFTGFEVSDDSDPYSTLFFQFFPNHSGNVTLTIETLSFNKENSIQSAYFQQILDNSSDFIYKSDVQGFFVYTNKTMRERYELDNIQEIGNVHFTHLVREDYKELVKCFYADQLRTKTPVTYLEFPTVTNSGEEIWVGQNVEIITSGNWILGIQAMSRDITENKIIENELLEIQGKNQAILDSIPDSIFVIDETLKIYDRKVVPNLDFLADIRNENISSLINEEHFLEKLKFSLNIAFEYKTTQKIELRLKENEEIFHFDVRITNIDEEKTLVIFRDITDTKLQENNLKIAQEKEKIALNAKQRYLSFMAHEIRTPLNAIMGLNDLLLDTSPTRKQVEYLKNIKSSSSILSKIINDVLDFNKLESENIRVEKRDFNLKKMSKDVINSCLVYSYGKPVELVMDLNEETPVHLNGDSFKVTQILTNLIGNALKFTEKGQVKLSILPLTISTKKASLKFKVEDTGIGIPKEKLHHIFDSYEQVDASISRKFGGTGLGLTITKKFVELLGGDIKVTSEYQRGTEFSFVLEFGIAEEIEESTKRTIKRDLSSNSILLVEDNEMNQLVMSKYFKKWGLNYEIAENGEQALLKLEEDDYQLILLDLEMPVMDGFDTACHIRNHENEKINSIPIIAISATMYSEVEERLENIGVHDFIPKPFNSEDVYDLLVKHLLKEDFTESEHIEMDKLLKNNASYDLTYLIESSLNDMNYINKMIELFTTKSPDYLREMRELYNDSNLSELKKLAHKYRASVAIMGIKKSEKIIIDIESCISEKKEVHKIDHLLESLSQDVLKACEEINKNYKPK